MRVVCLRWGLNKSPAQRTDNIVEKAVFCSVHLLGFVRGQIKDEGKWSEGSRKLALIELYV